MTYKTLINATCENDAAIEAVAVAMTVYGWAKSTYAAGKAARVWWESDSMENGSHIARLVAGIIYIATALAIKNTWQYFTSGKAQAHWEFINAVVDDGVGLYGPSPMGDAVVGWCRSHAHESARKSARLVGRLGVRAVQSYGRMQAKVFVVV